MGLITHPHPIREDGSIRDALESAQAAAMIHRALVDDVSMRLL